MTALEPGSTAPDFALPGPDGRVRSFRPASSGTGALLLFFKTECPTCQLTIPFAERLYQRLQGSPIEFLAVGQNEKKELDEFRAKYRLSFPFAMDAAPWQVSNSYGLTNVPTFFLVNDNGKVVKNLVGHSKDGLEELLREASKLGGLPAPDPLFTAADAGVRAFQPG